MTQPSDFDPDRAQQDVDAWQLAGLPGRFPIATYLANPLSTQYRLIVDVLLDEQQHSLTGVAADDLERLIRGRLESAAGPEIAADLLGQFALAPRMHQLEEWGVVYSWDVRPERDDDFLRNASRYQLTELAAEFHRAVRQLGVQQAGSVAATFAPRILRIQLDAMAEALGSEPAAVAEAWAVVKPTLDGMAQAAAGWQGKLAGALAGAPDPDKITSLQETLRRYVDMWGAGVDSHSPAITDAVARLLAAEPLSWRPAALHSLGATAPEEQVSALLAEYRDTLVTLQDWFGGRDSQARRLRRQMRDIIAPMVRGQRTLAAVGGHVSRRAELLALAGRLERAADDDAAWTLWSAATGLFSARHLGTASPEPGGNPGAVSFWDAEPAPVEARLRVQGPRSQTGRPARIADRTAAKARARAAAAARREAAARTRTAILARSGLRLSAWIDLDEPQTETLLNLLAAVAAAPGPPEQVRTVRTGDGQYELRAEPAPLGLPSAVVHTPIGRLVHPDIRLDIAAADVMTTGAPV